MNPHAILRDGPMSQDLRGIATSFCSTGTTGTLGHAPLDFVRGQNWPTESSVTFERTDNNYPLEMSGCPRRDYRINTNLSANTAGTPDTLSRVQAPFARVVNYPSEMSDAGISQQALRREIRTKTVDSMATVGTLSHLQVPFERQDSSPSPTIVSRSSTGEGRPTGGYHASHCGDRDSPSVAKMVTVPEFVEITRTISEGSLNSGGVAEKNTSSTFLCCAHK